MRETTFTATEVAEKYPQLATLGELFSLLETEFYDKGEVICEFRVNDIVFSEKDEARLAEIGRDEVHTLTVKTSPVLALVQEAAHSASEYIDKLRDVSIKTADLFRTDDLVQAQRLFASLMEGAAWLTDMLLQIRNVSGSIESRDAGQWNLIETEYAELIHDLESAYQNKDFVLLADLLEYDWTTVLDSWLNLLGDTKEGATVSNESSSIKSENSLG